MGGGGVNHTGVGVLDQAHRLHGGGVGQAEEHQIGLVDQPLSLCQVFPLVGIDGEQFNIVPLRQPLVDLQAGGALLAVDVDLGLIHAPGPPQML